MTRLSLTSLVLAVASLATPALAHPVPFSYLDIRIESQSVEVTLVAHVFDLAHDLDVTPAERLLDPQFLLTRQDAIVAMITPRLTLAGDRTVPIALERWLPAEPMPERQSVRIRSRYAALSPIGVLTVRAGLFPYDSAHQTFVNVYEEGRLTLQTILDGTRPQVEYFSGSSKGTLSVLRRFVPAGVTHVLIGPEHLLFLAGLVLLGASRRQLMTIVLAFVAAHLLALPLAAFALVRPPPNVIDQVIALVLIYAGADNLMMRRGRDLRVWIALVFGFVHGFWFAGVLRDMDLPARSFGWALVAFNSGVDVTGILIVVAAAGAIAALRSKSGRAARLAAQVGSVALIAAGTLLFVQRVFFPGGFI